MIKKFGAMTVTKWDELTVEGTDQDNQPFRMVPKRDGRGDAFFRLNGTSWYEKDFITERNNFMHKMLDVSTGHITKETVAFLRDEANKSGVPGFIAYEKGEVGFFFPVIPEERPNLPEDLQRIINYAINHSCTWVMIDADGFIISDLEFEEWD